MFDKDNIQHNLKTGADSDLMFTREITDKKSKDINKLSLAEGIRKYPYLARSTGNSLKGMTEQITSNELRKGRTKSAPRQGNSSAEGSLEFELSPSTFDDNLEAVFRNEWKRWESDTKSAINLDNNKYADGFFLTRCTVEGEKSYNTDENFGSRRLLNKGGKTTDGLIDVPAGAVVDELTCGTKDIKYSVLKKLGGVDGEDLYQEFKHMAINSLNLDMQIGAIVTGSFDFMGNNNPKLLNEELTRAEFGGTTADRFVDGKTTGNDYMDNLPLKATTTDQFTTREGDLWINGKNITFAESLSFAINNGLEKKFALFVKNAISTQPLALDISGNLQTYVVAGESEELYNSGVDDATNEIMFALEDKDTDPDFVYVFQIFKTKFSDQDVSVSGADTMSQSHPYNSFEERAARVFRIAVPNPVEVVFNPSEIWTNPGKLVIRPNVPVQEKDIASLEVKVALKDGDNGELQVLNLTSANAIVTPEGFIEVTESALSGTETAVLRDVEVVLNEKKLIQSFGITEKEAPSPVTNLYAFPENKQLTITWSDPVDPDFMETEVDVVRGEKIVLSKKIKKGEETLVVPNLTNGTKYTINAYAVDENNNKSEVATATQIVGVSNISKELASKSFTDKDGSTYKFNETGKTCSMHYSLGDVVFDFKSADEPAVCAMQADGYADGVRMVYTYAGSPDSQVTLTLKSPEVSQYVPAEIVLTPVL